MKYDILKNLRLQAGLSQQQVADALGVTKSTISKYENGLRRVNSNHLEKLSELFHVEPIYILTGVTSDEWHIRMERDMDAVNKEERDYWENILLSAPVRALVPLLDKLNENGQQKAVERVEELTEIPRYQKELSEPPQAPSLPESENIPEDSEKPPESPTEPDKHT